MRSLTATASSFLTIAVTWEEIEIKMDEEITATVINILIVGMILKEDHIYGDLVRSGKEFRVMKFFVPLGFALLSSSLILTS